MNKTRLLIYLVLSGSFLSTSCFNYERLNEQFVERLNLQIQSGNYQQIYDESSEHAKHYKYSKEEFIERMETVVERMRKVDESLTMQKHKGDYPYADPDVFPPSRYAYRYIEKNGKRIGINISIDSAGGTLRLLDFCIYTEKDGMNENPPNDVLCVSDASKD
jgi:hypothetical protein